jgi:hypothetical protein
MEIVDALSKLSFSFWQVVVLVVLFVFRRELRELVLRIATVKVAGSEITLAQKSDTVAALKTLKSEIETGNRSEQEIVGLIESKIRNRLIVALANLKRRTTYLWPALVKAEPGSSIAASIRQQTIDRIDTDLESLRSAGVFDYEIELDPENPRGVHTFVIKRMSDEIVPLIAEVERSY